MRRFSLWLVLGGLLLTLHLPGFSRELSVATVERTPFAIKQDDGTLSGFSVDLWQLVASQIGVESNLQVLESFSELLAKVESGEADIAIGNISITAEREARLNFSHPVFDAGLQIMVPADGGSGGLIDAVFNWRMAGLVAAAALLVFVVGNLMWFFERHKAPYFQRSYRDGLWPSYWWAMHALISGGFEEHVPRSIPGRILGTVLLISTLFLVSAFVATLTSAMTVSQLQSDIRSVADLPGKNVGTTAGSTASAYLTDRKIKHQTFDSIKALFAAVRNKKLEAVVHDAPILAYYASHEGQGEVTLTGPLFKAEKYGIALAETSPLLEQVNRALLKLRENGQYQRVYERWFGRP
ncbi:MAG: transporter substrate-binding domain-containing protein [Burkholderiaceae bacterium]